jgi:uncharacterized membrane protein YdfJ with MMPL/SSD domain
MVLFFIGLAAIVFGVIVIICDFGPDPSFDGGMIITIGSVVLIIFFCIAIFNPMSVRSEIRQYESIKSTLESARENESIENTALQIKVIDTNRWLAKAKYWAEKMPAFHPKEILGLEPIR